VKTPRRKKDHVKEQKGFTLIELMIVIAIIGILALIAIPNFIQLRSRAYNASAQSWGRNAKTAQEFTSKIPVVTTAVVCQHSYRPVALGQKPERRHGRDLLVRHLQYQRLHIHHVALERHRPAKKVNTYLPRITQ
jgi:type IV pilus assembly protein PilA